MDFFFFIILKVSIFKQPQLRPLNGFQGCKLQLPNWDIRRKVISHTVMQLVKQGIIQITHLYV